MLTAQYTTRVAVLGNSEIEKLMDNVKDGALTLDDLKSKCLMQRDITNYIAQELHFLGRLTTLIELPHLVDLLEALHVSLSKKARE